MILVIMQKVIVQKFEDAYRRLQICRLKNIGKFEIKAAWRFAYPTLCLEILESCRLAFTNQQVVDKADWVTCRSRLRRVLNVRGISIQLLGFVSSQLNTVGPKSMNNCCLILIQFIFH